MSLSEHIISVSTICLPDKNEVYISILFQISFMTKKRYLGHLFFKQSRTLFFAKIHMRVSGPNIPISVCPISGPQIKHVSMKHVSS